MIFSYNPAIIINNLKPINFYVRLRKCIKAKHCLTFNHQNLLSVYVAKGFFLKG